LKNGLLRKNKMVIYHQADVLKTDLSWGDALRQKRMFEAFHSIGQEVFDLTGCPSERVERFEQLRRRLVDSKETAMYYCESVNTFTALQWVKSRPWDLGGFEFDCKIARKLKAFNIPTSVFYRDIHWRFDVVPTAFWKRLFKKRLRTFFAMRELREWEKSVDVMFLPHVSMAEHFPLNFPKTVMKSLPPGGSPCEERPKQRLDSDPIRLIYVGSIKPPVYDIRKYTESISKLENVHLTLVTRKDGLQLVGSLYSFEKYPEIEVCHAKAEELTSKYQDADIALAVMEGSDYLSFSMPIKIFEAISQGLPLIVTSCQHAVVELVEKNKIGWVVDGPREFRDLLSHLRENPCEIEKVRQRVLEVREQHSWESRAREVVETLTQVVAGPKED